VSTWTAGETDVVAIVAAAPFGGMHIQTNVVIIEVTGADGGVARIAPQDKRQGSQQRFALFVEGGPKKLVIDCGARNGRATLHYLYVGGAAKKILMKGLQTTWKIAVDNAGAGKGVTIVNASLPAPPVTRGRRAFNGVPELKYVITSGKLKRLQTKHGNVGGLECAPGVIAVGEDSPKGQVKVGPNGALATVLVCKALNQSNQYAYSQAYQECIVSNDILPYVEPATLKKISARAIGPAVIAAGIAKPIPQKKVGKRVTLTDPIVGKGNLVQ
jgi:hypothetical protein